MNTLLGTFATSLLNLLVTLITSVLTARVLLPAGRGELAEILFWGSVFTAYGMLALPTSVAMLSARQPEGPATVAAALLASSGLSVAIVAALFAVGPFLVKPDLMTETLIFGAAIVPSSIIGQTLLALDHGASRIGKLNLLRLLPSAVYAVVCVVLWLTGHISSFAFATANLAGSVTVTAYKLWDIRATPIVWPSWPLVRDMLVMGASVHGGVLLALTLSRLDQFYIVTRLTSQDMGFYAVALTVGGVGAGILAGVTQTVYIPRLSAENDEARRQEMFRRATLGTVISSLLLAMAVAITAPVLVPLVFGAEFQQAVTTASILALSQVPASYVSVACILLRTGGDWLTGSVAPAIGALVFALLLILLPASLRLEDIALCLVVAWTSAFAFVVARARLAMHLSLMACLVPTRTDANAIVALLRTHMLPR